MRRTRVILLLLDAALALAGVYLTCALRVVLNKVFSHHFTVALALDLFPSRLVFVAMWVWALSTAGAYGIGPQHTARLPLLALARCAVVATIATMVLMFLMQTPAEEISRSLMLLSGPVTMAMVAIGRAIAHTGISRLAGAGFGFDRIAIVGESQRATELGRRLQAGAGDAVRIVGIISPDAGTAEPGLGSVASLRDIINRHRIDRLVLADFALPRATVNEISVLCERMNVRLDMVADFLGLSSRRVSMWEIEGVPLITVEHREFTRSNEIVKRAVDIVASFTWSVMLVPVWATIAILIKFDSPGPMLHTQLRVGKGGRHFKMYKFRSMSVEADARRTTLAEANEKAGHIFKIRADPRVTRVGRWLRRLSIDELPQLFNVLKGGMSLVGPRPLPVIDVEGHDSDYSFWIDQRQKMLPGLTGLWQVHGRSDLPFKELVKYDLYYLEHWSLWLDLQILGRTVPEVIRGRGAY